MEIGDEQDRHSPAVKDFVMYINTEGLCQARWSKHDLPRAQLKGPVGLYSRIIRQH
jgi:hypothetical protein